MIPKILKLWHNTKAILKIDDKPTKGSNNLVTSGGVATGIESSISDLVGTASSGYNTLGEIETKILFYANQFTPMVVTITEDNGTYTSDRSYSDIEGARNMFRDVIVEFSGAIYRLVAEDSKTEGPFLFQNCNTPSDDTLVTSSIRINADNSIRYSQAIFSS